MEGGYQHYISGRCGNLFELLYGGTKFAVRGNHSSISAMIVALKDAVVAMRQVPVEDTNDV